MTMATGQARAIARFTRHLNETASVLRPKRTSNGRGGWESDVTTFGPYPAARMVSGMRPFERAIAMQTEGRTDMLVYFPRGTDVRIQDRVQFTGDAVTYEVIGFPEPTTMAAGLLVSCRRVHA